MAKKKNNKLLVSTVDDDEEQDNNTTTTTTNNDDINNKVNDTKDNDDEDDDEENEQKSESKGKMQHRHKLELKKLQQDIDKLNHAIPKKDKKAKDELAVKAKKMEQDLLAKHKEEMSKFDEQQKQLEKAIQDQLLVTDQRAISKAQLKRAKRAEEEEARAKQLEEDKKNYVSKGVVEANDFTTKLKPLSKSIKLIKSDGDCLYNAIANQLLVNGVIKEKEAGGYHKKLRSIAAQYIRTNPDEFLPYIVAEEDFNDADNPIDDYCQLSVLKDGCWGGHIELKAISSSLKTPIIVYNAYAPDVQLGEEYHKSHATNKPICLSYHKFAFTLGEHYNSVVPAAPIYQGDQE
ncbi:hypothetical protein SAMD00019534_122700 [Acytostelium subglobosum LB1]|uniref:hypothetical protein n=1 Tax=Acytostelium subglobosum LB1 TaxID=1410327 RepID=UPI0006452190|nr:hypothetical protein SAMD00019534_122700 [Acytostelium subglobosum LB1]GAM29094.1 hypothetical protein SAMD00019534_122700 [Acytostelium subglobosum LB1]|eukprot:XP_012747939.1 hypothetical protein SAMD00019534_122700 [Acytostelium subglobosum LB1]